jgi:ATP-dependent Zn protease
VLVLTDEEEEKLVLRTQGESAASIDAALRHAVYIADGEDRDPEVKDVVEAFEHRVYGTAREDLTLAKEEKWSVACHEAGHALAIHQLFPGRTVDYITIQPRTGSLGFVSSREDSSNARGQIGMTRKEIVLQMAVCLAGREAERLMLGEEGMSTGAGSDLMKANNLARAAVMRLGLDPEIGPLQITPEILSADPKLAEVAHRRVKAWLTEAEESARNLLEQHRDYLAAVATKLNETESMEENEFLMLMEAEPGSHKLDLKH